jgi:hypothetical protein
MVDSMATRQCASRCRRQLAIICGVVSKGRNGAALPPEPPPLVMLMMFTGIAGSAW